MRPGAAYLGRPAMTTAAPADPIRLRDLGHKAVDCGRLTADEALALYRGLDQPSLGLLAHDVRLRLNPPQPDGSVRVTYIVDRNLNPTNVCVTDCGFCAFYRAPGDAEAYVLPREVIYQKVEELLAKGGIQVLLQGGRREPDEVGHLVLEGRAGWHLGTLDVAAQGLADLVRDDGLGNLRV